jgi:RNA polymerase sigma-70 factor (ECF subfamily)
MEGSTVGTDPRAAERELVDRCCRGDMAAFEEVYRQHAGRLYSLALRMAGSAADAEDLVQDIFLLAHRKLTTFKNESSLGTWLYRLGVNQCLDFLRRRKSRREDTFGLDGDGVMTPQISSTHTAGRLTPSTVDLERAIAALPRGCRAAFLLHDVEGFDHIEVGRLLGISEGTSKSQVHKARLRIRSWLTGTDPLSAE